MNELQQKGTGWIADDVDERDQTKRYDDTIKTQNADSPDIETAGVFLIQNSWGKVWGDEGYGWLPYECALKPLSSHWWTIFKQD